MLNKTQGSSLHRIHRVKLIYVDGYDVLNQLTVLGSLGHRFDFSYYKRLGLPLGYRLNYSEGSLPVDFVKDGQVKVHIIKKGAHSKNNRTGHFKEIHVVRPYNQTHKKSLKNNKKSRHNNPYDNINIVLLALGYSITKIGLIIKRLNREQSH